MWKKVALLISVSVMGGGFVAATLLSARRLEQPAAFDTNWNRNHDAEQVVAQVDREFRDYWAENDLQVAEPADELLIARRLSLALVGTVPSLEEIRAFESRPADQRLQWWLSYLLQDDRYPDYIAERLARAFVGVENGPFIIYRRTRFVSWLSDQLAANRPYDQIIHDLVTSEGLWTDSPAVNFFTVTVDQNGTKQPDPIRLAARTSRAFLGMRIDCLQCHDDQLGTINFVDDKGMRGGTQHDFHQLAAFFAETQMVGTGVRDQKNQSYKYKYLGAENEVVVEPVVPFQTDLLPASGTRRERLAHWLTAKDNRAFARAIINRTWGLMFGKPLVDPVDSIPLTSSDARPGMELLTDDFVEHGYDLRRLIRVIASTEVFQRDWRADFEVTPLHESRFAVFPLNRLRPEQVSNSVVQAVTLDTINSGSHVVQRISMFGQRTEFLKRFGDRGEDEFNDEAGTIPQRLVMMNGEMVTSTTEPNGLVLNAPSQISRLTSDDARAVETLFLVTLSRRPNERELDFFVKKLAGRKDQERDEAIQDMYWLYFNSTEFGWNH
jgi:hypothetical protein